MDIWKICICGGGSLGIVCAGIFLSKGIRVSILSGHPDKWSMGIRVFDQDGNEFSGELESVTDQPEMALNDTDLVLLTVPGFLIEKTLEDIKPFLRKSMVVGSIVSSTGFFFAAHKILDKTIGLFGFQRVPFIARQRKYGEIGDLLGYKSELKVAIENIDDKNNFAQKLSGLFNTPTTVLNNFYEASLTNSNPILHTGRLYSMWKDYDGAVYTQQIKFYADWTDDASRCLIKMDEEFQELLRHLEVENNAIPSLLEYYESTDASSLTQKIKSIDAFKNILSPMKEVETGWVPDFSSRYFTEDFPFGLRFIKELAAQCGTSTPTIDIVYDWGINMISGRK